jgi:hypothetical protein
MQSMIVDTATDKGNPGIQVTKKHPVFSATIYTVSIVIILALFLHGYSYYSTPIKERPHHSDYRLLRPAGKLGLIYGIAGASMMVIMLIYTVRKRTRVLGQRPRLRSYLNFHIYLGIMGPLLVTLHTSFKVNGLVAISYWSMIAVALSGFFGRFLYQQIPRNINDQELSLKQIEDSIQRTSVELKERGKIYEDANNALNSLLNKVYSRGRKGAISAILYLMILNVFSPYLRSKFRRKVRRIIPIKTVQYNELFKIARRQSILRMQLSILSDVQKMFHYWHVIHKPFAIIMYIIMVIHIGVALWTGYGWIS